MTSVFTMWLKKHKLKTIRQLDILDCNGGDHGQHFATNFNPEIYIREVTAPARHWENGAWVETPAMQVKTEFDFEEVGTKNAYLMYHEELESLARFVPELERARFWMTFGDEYIKHLTVLQNVGMTRIDPVIYEGRRKGVPMGRVGTGEDIAGPAVFLASDDARYTSGSVLGADGAQAVGYFLSVPGRRFSGGSVE